MGQSRAKGRQGTRGLSRQLSSRKLCLTPDSALVLCAGVSQCKLFLEEMLRVPLNTAPKKPTTGSPGWTLP